MRTSIRFLYNTFKRRWDFNGTNGTNARSFLHKLIGSGEACPNTQIMDIQKQLKGHQTTK